MFVRAFASVVAVFLVMMGTAVADELRIQKVAGGRIEFSVPPQLALMDDATRAARYPGQAGPSDVLVDATGAVTIAGGIRPSPVGSTNVMMAALTDGLRNAPTTETWLDNGTRTINDRKFGFVEFIERTSGGTVYRYVYFSKEDDQMILFNVTCPTERLGEWKAVLHAVVSSTVVLPAP